MNENATDAYAQYGDDPVFRVIEAAVRLLADYHDHEVIGFEHVPEDEPALVVCNHGLATYENILLGPAFADEINRELLAMVDRRIWQTPVLRDVFEYFSTLGTRDNAARVLNEGEMILVMPGGMREAIKDRTRKYSVDWRGRTGFVRMSCRTGAPVILGACPRADDIFEVYQNPITPYVYSELRLPLPLFRGFGPTLIPRPVKLRHLLSEPIYPPGPAEALDEEDILDHHRRIVDRMRDLMDEALTL